MHRALKSFSKLVLILIVSAAVGFALIVAAYALPTDRMVENAAESVEIFTSENNYRKLIQNEVNSLLDNWTDAIMLSEAAYDGQESLLERAMLNYHKELNKPDAEGSVAKSFSAVFGGENESKLDTLSYGRYWHGYLIVLKPLMLLLNYGQIRELMGLVQLALLAALVIVLTRRNKVGYAAACVLAYASLYPPGLSLIMQFNTVYILTFIQLLLITTGEKLYAKRNRWIYHFMLVGCLTSYFDFLTYPLAAFGIPMLLLLSLYPDSPAKDFWVTVKCGFSWAFGYVGMWASKWLIGSLVTGEDIFSEAKESLLIRSGGAVEEGYSRAELAFHAIYSNLSAEKLFVYLMALVVLACAIYAIIKRLRINWSRALLLCAFMAAPLVWYALAANHSYIHYYFTYRTLSISVFAAALLALELAGRGAESRRALNG